MDGVIRSLSSFLENYYAKDRHLPQALIFDSDSESYYCSICLNDIRLGDRYRKLPICSHSFHVDCIDAWLEKSHSACPLCRVQVIPPQIISLNDDRNRIYGWRDLVSNVCLLAKDFLERMSNPLNVNGELTSMMCDRY